MTETHSASVTEGQKLPKVNSSVGVKIAPTRNQDMIKTREGRGGA